MSSRVPPSRGDTSIAASDTAAESGAASESTAVADAAAAAAAKLRRARALVRRAQAAAHQRRDAFAIACLRRAATLADRVADAALRVETRVLIGDLCLRVGRHPEALDAYLEALRLSPTSVDIHLALAHALSVQQLPAEAIPILDRAVRLAPDRPDIHIALGDALRASAQANEAEAATAPPSERAAAEAAPPLVDQAAAEATGAFAAGASALLQPAQDLPAARERARAEQSYEHALQLDAAALGAYRGLARLHADAGDVDRALAVLARGLAAAAEPQAAAMTLRSADLCIERARVLLRRDADGDATEAVGVLQQVLNLRPRDVDAGRLLVAGLERLGRQQDLVGAFVSLGASLEAEGIEAGRSESILREAVRAYEGAVALKADCLRAWLRLADVQLALGEPRAAVRSLEAAVAIDPEQPAAHVNLGWARRMTGDFAGGWGESVWHYRAGDKRRFEQPAWQGAPLGSRTLLLWADFALGDTIQDLRFLPLVRAAHPQARLIVECHHTLVSLVDASRALLGIDAVVATKAPLPAFDLQLPLRRVQEQFVLDLDAIPATTPYITVDPARAVRWRQRVEGSTAPGGRRRIGIVWAGEQTRVDARIKSAALADFAPLAAFHRQGQGLRLFSLQAGPHVDELIAPPRGLRVARLLDEAGDVAETAAAMRALDLIITVDTMTAHLAGALGVPVWVLTAHAPAWWLWHVLPPLLPTGGANGTTRSRWYPTMRLFQQTRAGDWDGVMQQVCAVLRSEPA